MNNGYAEEEVRAIFGQISCYLTRKETQYLLEKTKDPNSW
jgi:hypothetical protein